MITRSDLNYGQQASQLCHAFRQFSHDHPEIDKEWFNNSNYICLLSVKDELALNELIEKASLHNIKFSVFREPDIVNQITAICLAPCKESKKITSNLRLALK